MTGLADAASACAERVNDAARAEPGIHPADVEAVRLAADALLRVALQAAARAGGDSPLD